MTSSVLAALGPRPPVFVGLDFETYYDKQYTLRKMTTEAYVRDPRFETIGVSVRVGAGAPVWMEDGDFRQWAGRVDWRRVSACAHHAQFDGLVLSHRYGIRPAFWFDTVSLARGRYGPGQSAKLRDLAVLLGVGVKGDEVERAGGKHRRDFTAEEWLQYGVYSNNDNTLMCDILREMLKGYPREELWLIDMTVRMFTEPRFVADLGILDGAVRDERRKKRAMLAKVAQWVGAAVPDGLLVRADEDEGAARELDGILEPARAALASSEQFAALLRQRGVEPPTKDGARGTIFAFAKSDPGMQALSEHPNEDVRELAAGRLMVKSTLVETRAETFAGIGRRGAFPIYLNYCRAHTHRWSGGDGQNAQNLNRVDPKKPDSGTLRRALKARHGCTCSVADSGQIEARMTAWVAGEASVLDTFRRLDALGYNGEGEPLGDFYSERGSVYFGKLLSKKTTPVERQTSKAMELGLGFGQGWKAFSANLLKGFMGAPPVQFGQREVEMFGVQVGRFAAEPLWRNGPTGADEVRDVQDKGARLPKPCAPEAVFDALLTHCAVVYHLVRLYRTNNARVAAYWKTCDQIIALMAQDNPDTCVRIGPIEVLHHALRKPNGMVLHYPKLHRRADGYVYWGYKDGRMQWIPLYGGMLCENIVQSLARDVVAEQALRIMAAGWDVVTTTHDEVVSMPEEQRADACLSDMLRIMRTPPAWCADLPLNATGAVARSYGEAK